MVALKDSSKVKYTKENTFNTDRAELKILDEKGSPEICLVVDLGTFLIKYSLFAIYDESRVYLLNLELKDSKDIVLEGTVNSNLLKRDIERKLNMYEKFGSKFKVLLITPKPFIETSTIPELEYKEKTKEVVKTIREYVKSSISKDLLTDWAVIANYPEKDKVNVYTEGVGYDFVIPAIESVIKLDTVEYKILSPIQALLPLAEFDNTVKAIIDFGHSSVSIIITNGREILNSKIIQSGSKLLNEKINLPFSETLKLKHNSSIEELPVDVYKIIEGIKSDIKEFLDSFEKGSINKINEVIVIGGVANSDIENLFNLDSFSREIKPLTLDLENENLIPREPKNYLALSYGAVMNELYSTNYDAFQLIDYTSPKDSNLMKLKKVVKWFSNNKKYAYGITALLALSIGITAQGANKSLEEHTIYSDTLTRYSSELSSAQGQLMSLENEYQIALASVGDNSIERFNAGDLLNKMVAITPPNLNVKLMKLNSLSETGVLLVKSDDERLISTFITLLQDSDKGVFRKVNIGKLDLKEVNGIKYYENQLFVEGFDF